MNKSQENKEVFFIFEKRGTKEDKELKLEFRRICDEPSFSTIKFSPFFADKKSNSTGLQIANLTARPIGLNYLKSMQENRAYNIIKRYR